MITSNNSCGPSVVGTSACLVCASPIALYKNHTYTRFCTASYCRDSSYKIKFMVLRIRNTATMSERQEAQRIYYRSKGILARAVQNYKDIINQVTQYDAGIAAGARRKYMNNLCRLHELLEEDLEFWWAEQKNKYPTVEEQRVIARNKVRKESNNANT